MSQCLKFIANGKDLAANVHANLDNVAQVVEYLATASSDDTEELFDLLVDIFTDDVVVHDETERKTDNFDVLFVRGAFGLAGYLLLQMTSDEVPEKVAKFVCAVIMNAPDSLEAMEQFLDHLERRERRMTDDAKQQLAEMKAALERAKQQASSTETGETVELTNKLLLNEPKKKYCNALEHPTMTMERYRDTLIYLAREDYLIPFRDAVRNLKEHTLDTRDLHIYNDVHMTFWTKKDEISPDSDMFLSFKVDYERSLTKGRRKNETIDWWKSKRLENRNMLIISRSPECRSVDALCLACKCDKKLLRQGIVPVKLIRGQIQSGTNYYMYEPMSNWSGHSASLRSLSDMSVSTFPPVLHDAFVKGELGHVEIEPLEEKLPADVVILPQYKDDLLDKLSEHIYRDEHVDSDEHVDRDEYSYDYEDYDYFAPICGLWSPEDEIYSDSDTSISEHEYFFDWAEWPFDKLPNNDIDKYLRVDHEQYPALKHAISHSLTLVNGAPGTGKTHMAREFVRLLLSLHLDSPIVVCTYTNHSIDAFLEGIIDILETKEFVRCGGRPRTTDERILKHQLDVAKYSSDISRVCYWRWKKGQENLQKIENLAGAVGEIRLLLLSETLSKETFGSKVMSHALRCLTNCQRQFQNKYPIFTNEENDDYWRARKVLENKQKAGHVLSEAEQSRMFPLPGLDSYILYWILGHDYYQSERQRYRELLANLKQGDKQGYKNPFAALAEASDSEDENEEEEANDQPVQPQLNPLETKKSEIESVLAQASELLASELEGAELNKQLTRFKHLSAYINHEFVQVLEKEGNPVLNLADFVGRIGRLIHIITEGLSKQQVDAFREKETTSEEALGEYFAEMKLIAMTSTVASFHREALAKSKCEVFIIEEAGELTESMVAGILPRTVKHLMLIGDYNQLRPKVEYKLSGNPHNYDISAFERLVTLAKRNHLPLLHTLSVQRRMHPDISRLVRAVFYDREETDEELNDCETMANHGSAFGVPKRVQFILHNASLVVFFIARGYQPSDITVVSLYKGQMFAIQEELEKLQNSMRAQQLPVDPFKGTNANRVKVKVLDDYQGEEDKVIIVSLTRSQKPGFVKNRNRALVTLSRAREHLVVLGYAPLFGKRGPVPLWRKISRKAAELGYSNESDPGLEVSPCPVHNRNDSDKKLLCNAEEILRYRFNFCTHTCNAQLACGHVCHLPCHCQTAPPGPHEHDDYVCPDRCLHRCPNNHQCKETCGKCQKQGHPKCQEEVQHHFEECGHTCTVLCYQETEGSACCSQRCEFILPCGHQCPEECGACRSAGHHGACNAQCDHVCSCGHQCSLQCGHSEEHDCHVEVTEPCPVCEREVTHFCGKPLVCRNPCQYILPCGHKCPGRCNVCSVKGHQICNKECGFVFPCGHKCRHKCRDTPKDGHQHYFCEDEVCKQLRDKDTLTCLHTPCQVCKMKFGNGPCCPMRCRCRCQQKCKECGEPCMALANEKCAFFCDHHLGKANKPGKNELVFVFHDKHWMPYDEAQRAIVQQYCDFITGDSDIPHPVQALTCPCQDNGKACQYPIIESVAFSVQIKETMDLLRLAEAKGRRQLREDRDKFEKHEYTMPVPKFMWCVCSCGELIAHEYTDEATIVVTCPQCGQVRGTQFE